MAVTVDRGLVRSDAERRAWEQARRYARDLREEHVRLQSAAFQSLAVLANALDAKDAYTRGHSDRVAEWSTRIALRLGLAPAEVTTIRSAGLLHDIGKIGVPDSILLSTGRLDPAQRAEIQRHPEAGERIVAPLGFFTEGARIIRHHHERIDGSGYPDGLSADRIPIGARIVAAADTYDALSSDRSYRSARDRSVTAAILRAESGVTLDRDVVDALFAEIAAREAELKRTPRD